MSLLTAMLPKKPAALSRRATLFAAGLACLTIAVMCFDENVRQYANNVHVVQVGSVPKALITMWITYGFASSALHFMRMAFGASHASGGTVAVQ